MTLYLEQAVGSPAVDSRIPPTFLAAEVEQEQRRAERLAQKLRELGVAPGTLS
ncbi:hypothetical protein NW848_08270 [Synechococcus sp. RC10A2]|uniref:hypothetical protein n=1 Tax=Synechococcus sp. (strain JA-3-3Ab) TaxID=321327 RepID=UPI0002D6BAF7|nr:hypothetical protein [Synechococcus sp. JA-3-3Ab]